MARHRQSGIQSERVVLPGDTEDDYTAEEVEFMMAMEKYQREKKRRWPLWSEALRVAKGLGYRKAGK